MPRSLALRAAAAALGSWNLTGCTLAVTVEPCTMCAGALVNARVARVVFGCWEPKTGAAGSLWDVLRDRRLTHRVEVRGDVLADECAAPFARFLRRAADQTEPERAGAPMAGSSAAGPVKYRGEGSVSERPKEHASKACERESVPWVQIPPLPPQPLVRGYVSGWGFLVGRHPPRLGCAFRRV